MERTNARREKAKSPRAMMAMFGWTAPKMPTHYIAPANRKKLGISGMEKIVGPDQS
jgi:hypothetical protein